MLQMTGKNKSELVKQIEAYGLKSKLADLAHKEQARRPFRHLPKLFAKGILIGNIAIVPKKLPSKIRLRPGRMLYYKSNASIFAISLNYNLVPAFPNFRLLI